MWSEKIRIEYRSKLKKESIIEGEFFRGILDSYQIASGYETGVGYLLALKDFVRSGHSLTIKDWMGTPAVKIENFDQLRVLVQKYDPVIDILQGEEFKNE